MTDLVLIFSSVKWPSEVGKMQLSKGREVPFTIWDPDGKIPESSTSILSRYAAVLDTLIGPYPYQSLKIIIDRDLSDEGADNLAVVRRKITGYAALNRSKPDHRHIDAQRIGKLVWKRK